MIKRYTPLLLINLLMVISQPALSQDSTYRLLKFITGSGGILYSNNLNYIHLATVGETILGNVQSQNHFLRSGFWNYPPFGPSDANDEYQAAIPNKFNLYQNYPNPFNPLTIIKYDLPQPSVVKVEIFNILGEKILVLVNSEIKDAGFHQITWNGRNSAGNLVSSGAYIYRIEAKTINSNGSIVNQDLRKMIFLK